MLVALLVGFCCGVMLCFFEVSFGFVSGDLNSIVTIFGLSLCVLFFCLLLCVWGKYRPVYGHITLGFLFALTSGMFWAALAWEHHAEQKVSELEKVHWLGEVVGLPEVVDGRVKFLFKPILDELEPHPLGSSFSLLLFPKRILPTLPLKVTWYAPSLEIKPGQVWSLPMTIRPSEVLTLSGVGRVNQQGLKNEGLKKEMPNKEGRSPTLKSVKWTYHIVRYDLKRRLLERAGGVDGPVTPLLLALLLGDRSLLVKSDWQLLSDTGTSHLIAISGLHIGLVASFVYFISLGSLRLMQRVYSRSVYSRKFGASRFVTANFQLAYLLALLSAWVYGAMAGYSIPTERACLMATVIIAWRLVFPVASPWLALLIAAVVILLLDPVSVMTPSFWLSFAAVALIFMVLRGRVGQLTIVGSWLRVQFALFVGLMPLSLWYFGKVALLSAVANLVAVPLVGWLIVPLSFLYSILLVLCGTELESLEMLMMVVTSGVFSLITMLIGALVAVLEILQSWDAVLYFPKPPVVSVYLAVFAALLLCTPRAVPAKWLVGLMFLPLFAASLRTETDKQVDFLPSGQLLMVIDRGADIILLGSKDQSAGWVQSRFERYLQQKGIKNELAEPVLSLYRQWTSAAYFMLRIQLQSGSLRQWAATEIEDLPICREQKFDIAGVDIEDVDIEDVDMEGIKVESLVDVENPACDVLLTGYWGRYLLTEPKRIDDQLAFLDKNTEALSQLPIHGLLVGGEKPLSGALLNVLNSGEVVFWGRSGLDQYTQQRILARKIRATLL